MRLIHYVAASVEVVAGQHCSFLIRFSLSLKGLASLLGTLRENHCHVWTHHAPFC
jgi:hypothetical protein